MLFSRPKDLCTEPPTETIRSFKVANAKINIKKKKKLVAPLQGNQKIQ